MEQNFVNLAGYELKLSAGDSPERMLRVAQYVQRTLNEAGVREGEDGASARALLDMADKLFMAQDEGTRLRKELLKLRATLFELENENQRLNHELSGLKAEKAAQAEAELSDQTQEV